MPNRSATNDKGGVSVAPKPQRSQKPVFDPGGGKGQILMATGPDHQIALMARAGVVGFGKILLKDNPL